jgi:uncharacterized membrane protein
MSTDLVAAVELRRSTTTRPAAVLCAAAGIGHLVVVQQQLDHGIAYVLPFVGAAVLQLVLARVVLGAVRSTRLLSAAAILCAMVALYVVVVAAGLTIGPHQQPEQSDWLRTAIAVAQLGAVAFLLRGLEGVLRRRAFNAVLVLGVVLWAVNLQLHP